MPDFLPLAASIVNPPRDEVEALAQDVTASLDWLAKECAAIADELVEVGEGS